MQVVANLNGNPAHLALLCQNRQKAFELDLTGSTLTFLVCPTVSSAAVHDAASMSLSS